jgi:hypothetical protein
VFGYQVLLSRGLWIADSRSCMTIRLFKYRVDVVVLDWSVGEAVAKTLGYYQRGCGRTAEVFSKGIQRFGQLIPLRRLSPHRDLSIRICLV